MDWLASAVNAVVGSESDEEPDAARLQKSSPGEPSEPEPEPEQQLEPGGPTSPGSDSAEPSPRQQQDPGTPVADSYGWGFGEALSGLDQFTKLAADATAMAAAQATELAKQAGADDILDAYKRDFAEFASVMSDDAKVIDAELGEAKVKAKERAAELAKQADAASGGQLSEARRALKEGLADTMQVAQAVGSELGLADKAPAGGALSGALREAIAPLRVDRYGEMVQGLRADQATFAAAPADYSFIEWREARTRPDGSRLPHSPVEDDAKGDAEKDEAVQRWLAELVPEVISLEAFWDRYLFRLAAFEAAEAKRAALMQSAAAHRSPTKPGEGGAEAAGGEEDDDLDGWGDSEEDDDDAPSEALARNGHGAEPPAAGPELAAGEAEGVLEKLAGELSDEDDDADGWGDDDDAFAAADDDAPAAPAAAAAAAEPAVAEATAAQAERVAQLQTEEPAVAVAAADPPAGLEPAPAAAVVAAADSDDDSLDSWGADSLSD